MEEDDKKRIKDLLPNLVNEVSPTEILPYLNCLSDMARQQIVNCEKRESSHDAMMNLYHHLIRKNKGFTELGAALKKTGKEDLAHRLISGEGAEYHSETTSKCNKRSARRQTTEKEGHLIYQRKKVENGHDTYIRDLNVCAFKILDQLDYSGQENWESLAGHLGLSFRQCQKIKHDAKSSQGEGCTRTLLDQFSEITLGDLLFILRNKMKRMDIVNQLEEFTCYRLPRDEKDNKSGQNSQPLFEVSRENINTPDDKKQVEDKDVFKTTHSSTTAKLNESKIEITKYKNTSLQRILKNCSEESAHGNRPIENSSREKDCILQNQIEIDGLTTPDETTQAFSCIDNNAISSIETVKLYAREEAGMETDECDVNDLKEYNALHPRTDRFYRLGTSSLGPSEHVPAGSPLTCLHPNAICPISNGEISESDDHTDEVTMISIGDPRSVHHYQHPETGLFSIESLKIDSMCDDQDSILSSKDRKPDVQINAFESLPEKNEERLVNTVANEHVEERIDEDADKKISTDHQLSGATIAGNQPLPNWDMLRSESVNLTNTNLESSTTSLDSSNSSSELAFLKEIDLHTRENVTFNANSSSQHLSLNVRTGIQSNPSRNQAFVLNGNKDVFNTVQDHDREYKYRGKNNNLEFMKYSYDNVEVNNLQARNSEEILRESKEQLDVDKEVLLLQEDENTDSLRSNDEGQNISSINWMRNILFVTGGAVLASLAYKSLKG